MASTIRPFAVTPATARPPGTPLDRRDCLKALAAVSSLALPVGSAASSVAAASGLWLRLFAGPAGGPVFWLTRGTEFIVVDGLATPVKGRISAIAAVARPRDGGSTRVSYLLQGINVTATGFDFLPSLVHPITGEETSTAVGPPLELGWMLSSTGVFTEELLAANGTRATYRGETWESPGTGDERTATVKMNIRLDRPSGAVETFTEVSRVRPRPTGNAASTRADAPAVPTDDFIAAESETFTVHELPDKAKYKGTTALSMSMNNGINCRGVGELRRLMRPAETTALAGFFERLPGWLRTT